MNTAPYYQSTPNPHTYTTQYTKVIHIYILITRLLLLLVIIILTLLRLDRDDLPMPSIIINTS